MTSRKPTVRMLGPIDVETGDRTTSVGGHGPRALLAMLAVRAGHAVPVASLREVLWREHAPPSADSIIQSYVSRLRGALGEDAIVVTDHSYLLDLDDVDIDALRFEGLVRRAHELDDPAERLATSREALALWRGRPFGDLADEEPFELESYRLDGLREAVMELSLDAELRLGRHELVVGELESAVREQPFNERLWFLLIQALALCERRVEALRACAQLRRTLGEAGIGVEERIVCLERRILDGSELTVEQTSHPCERLTTGETRPARRVGASREHLPGT